MDERSLQLRRLMLSALAAADKAHVGSARSLLEIFRVLYDSVVRHDPRNPAWPGIDYYIGQAGVASDGAALATYDRMIRAGIWGAAYPPPPHHYPAGIETPRTLFNLTCRLLHGESHVRKFLGGNWLRVMKQVCGDR